MYVTPLVGHLAEAETENNITENNITILSAGLHLRLHIDAARSSRQKQHMCHNSEPHTMLTHYCPTVVDRAQHLPHLQVFDDFIFISSVAAFTAIRRRCCCCHSPERLQGQLQGSQALNTPLLMSVGYTTALLWHTAAAAGTLNLLQPW